MSTSRQKAGIRAKMAIQARYPFSARLTVDAAQAEGRFAPQAHGGVAAVGHYIVFQKWLKITNLVLLRLVHGATLPNVPIQA